MIKEFKKGISFFKNGNPRIDTSGAYELSDKLAPIGKNILCVKNGFSNLKTWCQKVSIFQRYKNPSRGHPTKLSLMFKSNGWVNIKEVTI